MNAESGGYLPGRNMVRTTHAEGPDSLQELVNLYRQAGRGDRAAFNIRFAEVVLHEGHDPHELLSEVRAAAQHNDLLHQPWLHGLILVLGLALLMGLLAALLLIAAMRHDMETLRLQILTPSPLPPAYYRLQSDIGTLQTRVALLVATPTAHVEPTLTSNPAPQKATDTPMPSGGQVTTTPVPAQSPDPSATPITPPAKSQIRANNINVLAPALTLTGHNGFVRSLSFAPDGSRLASASADATVLLWSTADGTRSGALDVRSELWSAVFAPDGKLLVSGGNGLLALIDTTTQQIIKQFTGHTTTIKAVAISKQGLIVSGADDSIIRLWNRGNDEVPRQFLGHNGSVRSIAFSPDGSLLASGSESEGIARLWDIASGAPAMLDTKSSGVFAVAFSNDGKLLAIGTNTGKLLLWDVATRTEIGEMGAQSASVRALAFSGDGSMLAAGTLDPGSVQFWQVSDRQLLRRIDTSQSVLSLAFSPDGSMLAAGTGDNTVMLWRAPNP